MGNKRQAQLRKRASAAQGHVCHWCRRPMWGDSPEAFKARYRVRDRCMHWLQETAEHVVALSDGGGTTPRNIVAAHYFCNAMRHRRRRPLPPDAYQTRVLRAASSGRWPICRMLREVARQTKNPQLVRAS